MPDLFFIGVGGAGAKTAEALVYLAACGAVRSATVHVLLVDPDTGNGNVDRALRTLDRYRAARASFRGTPFLSPEILGYGRWSPFPLDDAKVTFESFLGLGHSGTRTDRALLRALYSEGQRSAHYLSGGFYGDPAVGSLVFARADWTRGAIKSFMDRLHQTANQAPGTARVVIAGSVVGGTGASGVPTLARRLADFRQQANLATILLLPYFTYDPPATRGDLVPDAADFQYKARLALDYYGASSFTERVDAIYLLGEPRDFLAVYPGHDPDGGNQENPPDYVELVAALACADFVSSKRNGVGLIAREVPKVIAALDLPYSEGWLTRMTELARLAHCLRFTFDAYLERTTGQPVKRLARRAPWVSHYFASVPSPGKEISDAVAFGNGLLVWLGAIEHMCEYGNRKLLIELADLTDLLKVLGGQNRERLRFTLPTDSAPSAAGEISAGGQPRSPGLVLDVWNAMCTPTRHGAGDKPHVHFVPELAEAIVRESNLSAAHRE